MVSALLLSIRAQGTLDMEKVIVISSSVLLNFMHKIYLVAVLLCSYFHIYLTKMVRK